MGHRHEAPQTQRDTSWVKERPRSGGFCLCGALVAPSLPSPGEQRRMGQVRVEKGQVEREKEKEDGAFRVGNCRHRVEDGTF